MNLIRTAIQRPVAVVSAVLMIVMFGLLALRSIPIQLTPDVNRPVITITTNWRGAAPVEIEREIINRQEEVLKGLEGLTEIEGRAQDGRGRLALEFRIGQNMHPPPRPGAGAGGPAGTGATAPVHGRAAPRARRSWIAAPRPSWGIAITAMAVNSGLSRACSMA